MSELKIEHITDYLHHYLITASDNRLSTCWKGEADYDAIESLQSQLEASEAARLELEKALKYSRRFTNDSGDRSYIDSIIAKHSQESIATGESNEQ